MPVPALLEIETRTRCEPRLSRETVIVVPVPETVRRATRTHRCPFLRSTVIRSVAFRVAATLIVAERFVPRFFTFPDSDATCGSGHPSFVIAYSPGHASTASSRLSPSALGAGVGVGLGVGFGLGAGQPFASVP